MARARDRFSPLLEPGERVEVWVQTYGELGTISGLRMLAEFASAHGLNPSDAALGRDGGFIVLTDTRLVFFEDRFEPALVTTASCPREDARVRWWESRSMGATVRHLFVTLTDGKWAHQLVLTRQMFMRRGVAADVDRLLAGVASDEGEPAPATAPEG